MSHRMRLRRPSSLGSQHDAGRSRRSGAGSRYRSMWAPVLQQSRHSVPIVRLDRRTDGRTDTRSLHRRLPPESATASIKSNGSMSLALAVFDICLCSN